MGRKGAGEEDNGGGEEGGGGQEGQAVHIVERVEPLQGHQLAQLTMNGEPWGTNRIGLDMSRL